MTFGQKKFSPSSYIDEHRDLAQQLMRETGVPASVILAVAIHESAYGNSKIAKHLNNHFGIKGKNSSSVIRSAYKGYESVLSSYRDFVALLKRRKATQSLFEERSSTDYQSWIAGIARSGYSVSGDWKSKVLSTINRYDLDQYDLNVR
ncbi:muramidase [Sphingobacterium alkalisoli]|nr:muramidase [Sphingobacterium alkalisoli]